MSLRLHSNARSSSKRCVQILELYSAVVIFLNLFWSLNALFYSQQVILVSANKLTRYIEPCQLTEEFGGSLLYDHIDWLNKRLVSTVKLHML